MKHLYLFFFFAMMISMLGGCAPVEEGTGKALSNVGSVIKHEGGKIWMPAPGSSKKRKDFDSGESY